MVALCFLLWTREAGEGGREGRAMYSQIVPQTPLAATNLHVDGLLPTPKPSPSFLKLGATSNSIQMLGSRNDTCGS